MNYQYFTVNATTTLEEVKSQYHILLKKNHPDLGGSTEVTQEIVAEYEHIIRFMLDSAFESFQNDRKEAGQSTWDMSMTPFYEVLKEAMELDGVDLQLIGFWIYAFKSFKHKDALANLGFWFSKKHRAWVFSGSKKTRYRSKMTLDQIKDKYGCEYVKRADESNDNDSNLPAVAQG